MHMAAEYAPVVAVGLSHHTAPVSIRERLAMTPSMVQRELQRLRESSLVREAMVLSTCNRVELYAVPNQEPSSVYSYLLRRYGGREALGPYLYQHSGREAVRHLFRVASSLDSLVVGEPQILGQVKEAVRLAGEVSSLGAILNRLTQRSLWVAKQVRNQTDIGRYNVGVGNAGVFLAQQIFSSLVGRRALLVGVGEMGHQVAKALLQTGISELLVANRTYERSLALAEEFRATPVRYERLRDYLSRVDIVLTATGAQEPIIGVSDVRSAMRERRNRPLFMVDLSVPRNIHPNVERVDQAYVFNVDDLTQVMERGKKARQKASVEAEALIETEADRFTSRLASLEINEGIGAMTKHAESLRLAEMERSSKALESLTPEQREAVEAMTKSLVKKVLHKPLMSIRKSMDGGDMSAVHQVLDAWREE